MKNIEFSIVVVTYNFEKIILECLEGIEQQTYKNFEVIISDDASSDKTVEICKKWKEKVKNQIAVTIVKSEKNEGVTRNYNKALKLATKEWIKIVDGDDILKKDALEKLNFFINNNLEARVIFSKAQIFYTDSSKNIDLKIIPKKINFYKKDKKEQFKELLEHNFIVAPTVSIKNELLKDMGYFDEKYRMVEDYPFWIKLLKHNIKFYFLDDVIIKYRKYSRSVSGKKDTEKLNPLMLEFEKQFYKDIYLKEVKNPLKRWDRYLGIKQEELILKNGNKSSFFSKILRYFQIKNLKKYSIRLIILVIIILFIKRIFY